MVWFTVLALKTLKRNLKHDTHPAGEHRQGHGGEAAAMEDARGSGALILNYGRSWRRRKRLRRGGDKRLGGDNVQGGRRGGLVGGGAFLFGGDGCLACFVGLLLGDGGGEGGGFERFEVFGGEVLREVVQQLQRIEVCQ